MTPPADAIPGPSAPPIAVAPAFATPALQPGTPTIPPPPAASSASAPTSSRSKNRWLIGGAIAAAVILVGSVGTAIGAGSNREPVQQASAAPAAIATQEPTSAEPTPTPTPPTATAPAIDAVDSVAFRAQAGSHLDDMNKDLDDMVVTVQEAGFWRLLSNSAELAFNLGQLEGLDVPPGVVNTWPASLTSLGAALDVLSDAVSTQDGPTILAAIEGVRAQVEAARGVANSAI